jgi:hypothetical protein
MNNPEKTDNIGNNTQHEDLQKTDKQKKMNPGAHKGRAFPDFYKTPTNVLILSTRVWIAYRLSKLNNNKNYKVSMSTYSFVMDSPLLYRCLFQ